MRCTGQHSCLNGERLLYSISAGLLRRSTSSQRQRIPASLDGMSPSSAGLETMGIRWAAVDGKIVLTDDERVLLAAAGRMT